MRCCASRITSRRARGIHTGGANWLCPAGDQLGELGAVILFDDGEGEVDARGDAGRRPDVIGAADEQRLGVDLHRRVSLGEVLGHGPVRRRAPAVEETGLGGQEGAVADADDAPRPGGRLPDPLDEFGVVDSPVDARAAGQQQGVDGFGGVWQCVGDELQSDAGVDRLPVLRHQPQVIGDGRPLITQGDRCGGEDVGRSRHVERLHPGEPENQHGSCHELIVADTAHVVQDMHPTLEDIGTRASPAVVYRISPGR